MAYVTSTLGSYTTGSVTVVNGSTAVTGSGTLWNDIVCEGDILTLDDSKLYFVASVNSNTSLTLDKPYAGSSASGQSYRIILNTAAHFPSDVAAKVERALSDLPAVTLASLPGVKVYSTTEDYSVADVVVFSGSVYICVAVNGPSTTVVNPGADTSGAKWKKIILTNATQSAAGYMSKDDKKLLDSVPDLGTFNKMFFSQTSGNYIAPRTGVYRITLKGGGGGGGGGNNTNFANGGGGAEGMTITSYVTLTKNQSYPYVIGAGGSAGANTFGGGTLASGSDGGDTYFTAPNGNIKASGGSGGVSPNSARGGVYKKSYTISGYPSFIIYGQNGASGVKGSSFIQGYARGGGCTSGYKYGEPDDFLAAQLGGGGSGGGQNHNGANFNPQPGADGFILIEYAG